MAKQIILKQNTLTREMAYLIDQELIYYYVESTTERNWQNCIVVGQVQNIVKNLKAVFIDYGQDKKGLLHFKQIPNHYLNQIKQGYLLPVQITKQNSGSKGDKLTAKLNITGKHLICLPFEPGIYFSKKIKDATFKAKLKQVLEELAVPYGFIIRTHAAQMSIEEILEDAKVLSDKTKCLLETGQYLVKGSMLYEEHTSIEQMLIEQLIKRNPLEIICDKQETQEQVKQLINSYGDATCVQLNCLEAEHNIFSNFGLTKKIEQLTKRKIWLKCGGNLMIDETEAMTVIDVNSARAILIKDAEKALLELNKEAIKESILQILRRNLSGIILVDLIETNDATTLYQYAKTLLKDYEDDLIMVYPLTELGLLQFSRTKKQYSITQKLLESCSTCHRPHSQNSLLANLMKLETQLKSISLQEVKQTVYLGASPNDYEKMVKNHIIERLEEVYPIQIELEKTPLAENQILCQFYKK